jgi:excisionase family DNA binding protein
MSMTNQSTKLAYSVREACSASSLGRTTIYAHIAAGRLRAVRIGGRTVIPADSLHGLVNGTGRNGQAAELGGAL